jgi:dihydroorotase
MKKSKQIKSQKTATPIVVIEGYVASHDKKPYLGQVTIDQQSGLITQVKKISKLSKEADMQKMKQSGASVMQFDKDNLLFPGMGDIHIHAREDESGKQMYKEEYVTALAAAKNGGCVFAAAMPNTPNPLVTKEQFDWHRKRIASLAHPVSMFNYIGIDTKTKPVGKPGEYFYKLYFGKSVGDLTVTYASELDTILSKYVGHYISFHVEYEPIVQASAKGETHSDRRPVSCVNEGLRLLLPLIKKYKIHAKLCHWSTGGESFDLIKEYQKQGCDIVLEVSPLHLLFDTNMTTEDPSLWLKIQMNPAIQSAEHRKALISGLKSGFIQYLATDHAPHTLEEKYAAFAKFKNGSVKIDGIDTTKSVVEIAHAIQKKDMNLFLQTCKENGMSGAPWLDTYAQVCVYLMRNHGFTTQDIARVSAYNPGAFVNKFLASQFTKSVSPEFRKMSFGKGFGKIEKGYLGNITVINTKKESVVTKKTIKTKPNWSPLEGWKFDGSLEAVIIRGGRV